MHTLRHTWLAFGLLLWVACGGGGNGGGETRPGVRPPGGNNLPCRAASCGDVRFRNAIPTRDLVRIDFGANTPPAGALADFSPYYDETETYVDDINAIIDGIFSDLEFAAGAEPEVLGDEHIWRATEDGLDVVLDIEETAPGTFRLTYFEGPPGFSPELDGAQPIIDGEIDLDGDDFVDSFELFVNLDAWSDADPAVDATGDMFLAASPFGGGLLEVAFDLRDVSLEGETPENSQTTYWIFGEDDHALEYLAEVEDVLLTAFVRWDDLGGRWDSHALFDHPELGLTDYIVTNCWDEIAAELFDGEAWIQDSTLDFYGELDGDEANCHFAPVDGHPNPGDDFDDLPAEGEWDAIDFLGCDPADELCEDVCDPAVEDCGDVCDPAVEDCCDPAFEDCGDVCDPEIEDCCDPDFEDCCDPDFEDCCDPDFEDCCDPFFEECL
ncbi:MAG: hypothetical protein AAGE52_14445 [Myxococcota bacterium]